MRKAKECRRQLKRCDRITSQIVCRGGPNKEARVKRAVRDYLAVGRDLSAKVDASLLDLCDQPVDTAHWEALAYFHRMLDKHLDLIQRRLLHEETIPAHEKVFSLFEPCLSGLLPNRDSACAFPFVCDGVDSNVVAFGTQPDRQGLNRTPSGSRKASKRPNVELGHRLLIATVQHQLIQDYDTPVGEADVDQSVPVVDRLLGRYGAGSLASLSFDKGLMTSQGGGGRYNRWFGSVLRITDRLCEDGLLLGAELHRGG